jgi:hypothetical protein
VGPLTHPTNFRPFSVDSGVPNSGQEDGKCTLRTLQGGLIKKKVRVPQIEGKKARLALKFFGGFMELIVVVAKISA